MTVMKISLLANGWLSDFNNIPLWGVVLMGYGFMGVVTFCVYGWDKKKAETQGWRIPEATLHLLELALGWPGAWLAQRFFRHKTRKVSFQIWFWIIGVLHFATWGLWGWKVFQASSA